MTDRAIEIAPDASMPIIGFGTWRIKGETAYTSAKIALDVGYPMIDTAASYGNEDQIGRALLDSGRARDDVFITTKIPPNRVGRERATLEASLQHLGTDHLDLWLIHWPPESARIPEMWQQLIMLRDEGLTRSIGVSNYDLDQIDILIESSGEAPAVNQISWSPATYHAATLDGHRERGVVVEGFSGLSGVDLGDATLAAIADAHGVSPAQVVIRWHIEHGIAVIPKSVHEERIVQNHDVFGFELTPDEIERIDGLSHHRR